MTLAYLILAHVQPRQLARLIRRLDGEGEQFLLHIDRKTPLEPFQDEMGETARLSNVRFVERTPVHWGAFGQLRATLNGLQAAARSPDPYDYLVLLTGRDYPLKPVSEIRERLVEAGDRIFLEHNRLPRDDWPEEGGLERLHYPHVRLFGPRWRFPAALRDRYIRVGHVRVRRKRPLPPAFKPYQGSSFWWFPRDCVNYLDAFLRKYPDFLSFFRRAFAPEESFFQMVLLNSPHASRVVNDNLRYTEWRQEDWPHGSTLRTEDLPKLASTGKLFGSKFDTRRDARILDLIDQQLLNLD